MPLSAALYPFGRTHVTVTAYDALGSQASRHITVSVADTQPPSIACPANLDLWCVAPLHARVLTWLVPNATGNIAVLSVTSDRAPGLFQAGFDVVTHVATDTSATRRRAASTSR